MVSIPSSRAARNTRTAISPRLATSNLRIKRPANGHGRIKGVLRHRQQSPGWPVAPNPYPGAARSSEAAMEPNAFNEVLTKFVRPYNFPLAVRMLRHGETPPARAKKPLRDFGHPITLCQGVAVARHIGWPVYMDREDQACILGATAMGFEKLHPYYLEGNLCEN